MMQVGTNQSTAYHSQSQLTTTSGQTGRSSSNSRQQQQSQYDNDQLASIRPRLCILRKWPHYDGYGVHLARNQHWLGLRIGDVEPNSPAESGGLLREDVVLAVNGHSVENDDFFVILSFIQHELEDDHIRFLVLDPQSADLARRQNLSIDENYRTCVHMETPTFTVSPEKLLYDQWRATHNVDPTAALSTVHLGPTLSTPQHQASVKTPRYQPKSSRDEPDVYTFLPYSDHAIENGKSFFDVLFNQESSPSSTIEQQPYDVNQHLPRRVPTGKDDDDDDDDDNDHRKKEKTGSSIKDGIKNLAKSGVGSIKSAVPRRSRRDDNDDEEEDQKRTDPKLKNSSALIYSTQNADQSPSFTDKSKNKLKTSNDPSHTANEEVQPQLQTQPHGYEPSSDPASKLEDTTNNLRPEPRMCSIKIRPGIDTIGISLQPDKDFGHIIKTVEPNSLADRAGIERDDCIVSLNDTPLLNIPYDDVLNVLRKSRNEVDLDFVVAQKSYLMKSSQKNSTLPSTQNELTSNTSAEVMPSSNIPGKDASSAIPPAQALEQLYNKYSNDRQPLPDDQASINRPREIASTTTTNRGYDRRSPSPNDDRYSSKQQQSGQIYKGVGPATADPTSWGVTSGKSADLSAPTSGDSTIRSNTRGRRPDTEDIKGRNTELEDSFKPLQVGITNQAPSPPISNNNLSADGNRTSRPVSSTEQRDISPKLLPTPDKAVTNTHGDVSSSSPRTNQSIQNVPMSASITPSEASTVVPDYEPGNIQTTSPTQSDLRLGSTEAMSVPSKPVKITPPANLYDDTDDDLSDITEKSDEEDESDAVLNKYLPSDVSKSVQGTNVAPHSDSSRVGTSDPYSTNEIVPNNGQQLNSSKDPNNKQPLALKISDVDSEPTKAPSAVPRQIVKARRLEQSDSEDTTSGADSIPVRASMGEPYHPTEEPTEDLKDTNNQPSNPLNSYVSHEVNQVKPSHTQQDQPLSKSSNQPQSEIHENDENDVDDDSNASISSEPEKPSLELEKMALATMPLSELRDHGYEFHNIQLMQPTETSPVGLKLTKQQDPLQYIITAVAKGTKADLAGLKVNDWLIKIEDTDIRSVEFAQVSQDIRQLLTNAGLINMVVARKKSPTSASTPTIQPIDKQQSSASRSESFNRPQGGTTPTSLLTTDITRDTPDNTQVRFVPDRSTSPSTARSQVSPTATRDNTFNAPGPSSVGLTNPISDANKTKSPRSQSRSPTHSPTREYTINQEPKQISSEHVPEEYDEKDIRHIVLKEALGLDFNSFIPEGDTEIQTHFISNVQPASMADKAGLRDGDRILTVNGVDVTNAIHEDVRRMMQTKKPLQLTVVNDQKYLELIENVKVHHKEPESARDKKNSPPPDYETLEQQRSGNTRADTTNSSRSPKQGPASDVKADLRTPQTQRESPKPADNDPSKYSHILFVDNKGSVPIKHCILKKDPNYNGYGLVLRYQSGLHLIDQVEEDSPAFKAGLRENDIILYVDKKNVESMTHDDVKILIKKLSASNTNIDLILMRKNDMPRYKEFQDNNTIDWKPILEESFQNEPLKTVQATLNANRPSNDPIGLPRHSSASSTSSAGKQSVPSPPASSSSQSALPPGTRLCILQPSADRTAGFALSGKTAPPYLICQVEKGSPAEKAGLLVNDALISINGKSVVAANYEETVKLVKEALQKTSVELIVRDQPFSSSDDYSKSQDREKSSVSGKQSNNLGTQDSLGGEPSQQSANAVEEYQKQRNKELSYTLRLCHLHSTNADGTQAATFGFELSEDPNNEYPVILRVEPQSPAEVAGLQSRDILLKINERKTKGLSYEKLKKEIEKAKRDGRLEMLVVDQETFDYCQRSNKPLKEPDMKVKHIFPKSRSSASFHKLPVVAAMTASSTSMKDNAEQSGYSSRTSDGSIASYSHVTFGTRLPTQKETDSEDEDNEKQTSSEHRSSLVNSSQAKATRTSHPAVSFDLSPPSNTVSYASAHPHETPLKFFDPAHTASQQLDASSSSDQNVPTTSRSTTSLSRTATKESKPSKSKSIPNAINNLFHKIGHSKSSKRS